jgi:multidrug efflux pump subunit AcrA (membrane-fusion protein)
MPRLNDIMYSVQASGTIKQIRAAGLYSSGYATVDKIYVNPGDEVKEGQVIMTVRPSLTAQPLPVLQASPMAVPAETDIMNFLIEILKKTTDKESCSMYYSEGNMIISPFDGIVTEIGVKETELITPLTKCAVVSDTSRMQAIVSVPESSISKIKRGMPVGITGDSFDGTYSGVVLEISHQIKSEISLQGESARYAEAVVELFDANRRLLPGSSVHAKIYTSRKKDVITLPYEAITQDASNRELVYVVEKGRAVKKYVQTGYELPDLVEIRSGISERDMVILSPSEGLTEGEKVVIRN